MKLGWRRILAWLIDWACILPWIAVTAAIGVPLYLTGVIEPNGILMANLIGALVMVVPVVIVTAWCESRSISATPGKRALRLRVSAGSQQSRFRITLVRNLLKIGLPWILGHAGVYAIVASSQGSTSTSTGAWILIALAYVIAIIYVASLFVASGRAPYDRITGLNVELEPRDLSLDAGS
ncbi:RDD family protein [Brevibacterium sp. FME37]|uniref:RDD family protein n=1 Tax=Brevibacterium sp. FME37 TaxID=2742607 RepID=UPI001866E844|nr:RDD family protein [Brevibacterium sp. FME37]